MNNYANRLAGSRRRRRRLPTLDFFRDETPDPGADGHAVLAREPLDYRDHVLREPDRHHAAHNRPLTPDGWTSGHRMHGIRAEVLNNSRARGSGPPGERGPPDRPRRRFRVSRVRGVPRIRERWSSAFRRGAIG